MALLNMEIEGYSEVHCIQDRNSTKVWTIIIIIIIIIIMQISKIEKCA
jgi:hypothetical protein